MNSTLTEQQKQALKAVSHARTKMLLYNGFYGPLAMDLDLRPDDGCGTAWTDGSTLGFEPSFILSLSKEKLIGLIAHEVLHCVMAHPYRRGNRDPYLWNVACDYAINWMLKEEGFDLPDDCLIDERFRSMSAEQAYKILTDEQKQEKEKGTDGQPGPGNDEEDGDDQGEGQGEGQGGGGEDDDQGEGDDDQDDGEGESQGQGQGEGKKMPAGEVRDAPEDGPTENDWTVRAETAHKMAARAGKGTGTMEDILMELKKPSVDWKTVLAEFVQRTAREDYTWRRPNRRFMSQGLYMPSLNSDEMPPVVFIRDTSGSMDTKALQKCTAELLEAISQVRPRSFVVLDADTEVQDQQEFDNSTDLTLEDIKPPRRGGGTCFRDALRKAQDYEPSCIIYFTDGFAECPKTEPDAPVLWAYYGDARAKRSREQWYGTPPFGETLEIEEHE